MLERPGLQLAHCSLLISKTLSLLPVHVTHLWLDGSSTSLSTSPSSSSDEIPRFCRRGGVDYGQKWEEVSKDPREENIVIRVK